VVSQPQWIISHKMMMLNRKQLASIFFLLCGVEGAWVFYSFWQDALTGNGLAGFAGSPLRLLLLGGVALLVVLCALLFVREILSGTQPSPFADWQQKYRMVVLLSAVLFLGVLAVSWVVLFSPYALTRTIAYYQRWQPLFVWGLLIGVQFYVVAALSHPLVFWNQSIKDLRNHPFWIQARRWLDSPAVGFSLLAIAFMLGLTKLVFGQFSDEANNLVYGWLVSKGYVIYRDVFSQHFPFAYYWTGIVVSLFGNSQAAVRISLLLLQAGLFGFSMWATHLYLPIGLATLVWGLTSQFHRGNMVLYDNFDGTFLTAAFILVFYALVARARLRKITLIVAGLCLGCALLSNPLLIYPALVILLGLFFSGWRADAGSGWREGLRRLVWAGAAASLVLGVYLAYLLISGTFQDFYRDAVWFNAVIYDQYTDGSPNRFGTIFFQLLSGLNLFNPQWTKHVSPFIQLGINRNSFANEDLYYSWIFSSLLFRLSILLGALGLLLKRRFLPAIFLYVFAAALLTRAETSWHAVPFIWLSLFAGAYFIVNFSTIPNLGLTRLSGMKLADRISSAVWGLVFAVFLLMYGWSAAAGAYFLIDNHAALNDRHFVNRLARFGDQLRSLSCNQDDLRLLIYPYNPMVYFVTQIPPASKYMFMHPWVAQVAMPELIPELGQQDSTIIEVKTAKTVWQQYAVKDYLADLIIYLDQNYQRVNDTLWMSKALAKQCAAGGAQPALEDDSP
jgi:hypothetical protein